VSREPLYHVVLLLCDWLAMYLKARRPASGKRGEVCGAALQAKTTRVYREKRTGSGCRRLGAGS
jgi:hypothetical protein